MSTSTKCAYVKFMFEKCKRERGSCHIEHRLLEDCNNNNLYFSGCSPQYKLSHRWINDTRHTRETSVGANRKNTGNH